MEMTEIKMENFCPADERLEQICVGIVDMVNSSIISTKLKNSMVCYFYRSFLDQMAFIVKQYRGEVVKYIGDSLLYYFPNTSVTSDKNAFLESIRCCVNMLSSRSELNSKLISNGLPAVSYRISLDFGLVSITQLDSSSKIDLLGPTVNICAKMNRMAKPNTLVIGGDLHHIVKDLFQFEYVPIGGYFNGLKLQYPVYTVKSIDQ